MKNPEKYIDHTNISTAATRTDIEKTCKQARHFGFRGVCVNPEWARVVAEQLHGTGIKTIVLIDPPMGESPHSERMRLCEVAKKNGADELDVVMNIVDMKYERELEVLRDLKGICAILPTKVIIGSGYLTTGEIKRASEIVREAGAMCVKTSTDKDPLDHFELTEKARHLRIMKEVAPELKIKAAGKIRTFGDMQLMIEAGADIIGTSSGLQIMQAIGKDPGE